jgi:hypothetical protein
MTGTSEMSAGSITLRNKATGFFGRVDLPYKVTKYDPDSETYYVLASSRNFAEAYNHRKGTHVVQTHGTNEEVQRMVTGLSSTEVSSTAQRVGIGFLLAGPFGAAVGAAMPARGGWHKLPHPIVTPKEKQT